MSFLIEPTNQYRDSFLQGVREFQREGRMLNYDLQRLINDFEDFLLRERAQRERKKNVPDHVPFANFWLIDEEEYIGTLTLRYELNDLLLRIGGHIGYQIRPSKRQQGYGKELLRLGLKKAQEIMLTRALVTCDENNIGSKKVIEYNGGQLENAVRVEGSSVRKLRYWIDLVQQ